MNSKTDLFIFFDNQDNLGDKKDTGWVTSFNRFLTSMIRQITGFDPEIRVSEDGKAPGPDELKDTIALVFIVSPASVTSPQLLKTVENFHAAALKGEKKEDITDTSRIFKVLKVPVALGDQPEKIRQYVGYELYDFDITTGSAQEITDFYSRDAERSYWMKMVDLAYDISEILMMFRESEKAEAIDSENLKVYLAETGPELHTQRNMIKRELQRSGIQVLPRESLPGKEQKQFITSNIQQCDVSVHLFGDRIRKKEGGDFIELQNEVASTYLK